MDRNDFSKIMQGNFNYGVYRAIIGRFRGGNGILIDDDNYTSSSVLSNSWHKIMENNDSMIADDGVPGDPYFFREMSGSMGIELNFSTPYRRNKK
jgi:hypothetical protein